MSSQRTANSVLTVCLSPGDNRMFGRLRRHTSVCRTAGTKYQPRLHDLRHTFAVHRLVAWYQQGTDVQKLLPRLATYLGHVDIQSTQHYLTMTPD
jgi:integrase/recombinase XerD